VPKRIETKEYKYRWILTKNRPTTEEPAQEKNPKYKPGKVKIVGESMIRGAAEVCRNEGCNVTVYPGIRDDDLAKQLQLAQGSESELDVIAIHVGTNNIRKRTQVHLITELDNLIDAAKTKWPKEK
jgi:2,3-bisphosphoglycerate-independent phosphoglycerate mutase